jgi:glycosyltransferase involved in cell wall biosynthesis
MSLRPACSVIIPTYNRMELLRRTLDSLGRQDLGPDRFEVLVVDDGSSDETADLVKRYPASFRLRYFHQPDEGFRVAAARNIGIAHAEGEVCVFIDSGLLLESRCLSAHLASHAGGEPTAVIGYLYCFNDHNEDAQRMLATLDFDDVDATVERLRRRGEWLDVRERFYATYGETNLTALPAPWLIFWAGNASANTAQVRKVGAFDEAFRTWGAEDNDLGYRLHREGARFVLNRDANAVHYPHDKDHGENLRTAYENYAYMAEKYGTPAVKVLLETPAINFWEINKVIRERGLTE